jgi:hypothetical protein
VSESSSLRRNVQIASRSRPSVKSNSPAVHMRGMAGVHACNMHFCSKPIIISVVGISCPPGYSHWRLSRLVCTGLLDRG